MTISEIASIAAIVVSLYAIISQRRFVNSQADSNVVDDALKLKTEYQEALAEVRAELKAEQEARKKDVEGLRAEFNSLLHGAWDMHAQLTENHIKPRYTPPQMLANDPLETQPVKPAHGFKK